VCEWLTQRLFRVRASQRCEVLFSKRVFSALTTDLPSGEKGNRGKSETAGLPT